MGNSRTPILHAPRSGASSSVTGGPSTPVNAFNPGHRSQSARVIRQPHSANVNNNNNRKAGTPHAPKTSITQKKQLNTAFYASPRKISAPSKLIKLKMEQFHCIIHGRSTYQVRDLRDSIPISSSIDLPVIDNLL